MKTKRHMSINIEGMLRNYKGVKINIFNDDNGNPLSDAEARIIIKECQDKGWKLIPMSDECEGFDPFGKGCPGHPIEDPNDEQI